MSELRTILLLIGIGVILAVYAWTRWQQQNRRSASKTPPAVMRASSTDLDSADIEQELQRMERLVAGEEPEAAEEPAPVAPVDEERLLVISVVAAEGDLFAGEALHRAFEQNKLRLGDKGIYQRLVYLAGKEQPVFGVANLVKPGTFPPGNMERFSTPGVTLFLQLPGPVSGLEAFDDFVKTAERLAVVFGAELRDEHHRVLTHQALMQIRENIAEARFRPRVAS